MTLLQLLQLIYCFIIFSKKLFFSSYHSSWIRQNKVVSKPHVILHVSALGPHLPHHSCSGLIFNIDMSRFRNYVEHWTRVDMNISDVSQTRLIMPATGSSHQS